MSDLQERWKNAGGKTKAMAPQDAEGTGCGTDRQSEQESSQHVLIPECVLTPLSFIRWPSRAGRELKTFLPACTPSTPQRPGCELEPRARPKGRAESLYLQGADSLVRDSDMPTLTDPTDRRWIKKARARN